MSVTTAKRSLSGPGPSTTTSSSPPTLQQRLASAVEQRPSRKDTVPSLHPISILKGSSGHAEDCNEAFKSPLFHYASKSHLPMLPPPLLSSAAAAGLEVRSRAATLGASHPPLRLAAEHSRIVAPIRPAAVSPKSRPTLLLSREASNRQRALSQPTHRTAALHRTKSTVTSTARGAPRDWSTEGEEEEAGGIRDMRTGSSSQGGHPGRLRGTISPHDVVAPHHAVSPLYAVSFPDAPLGRAEPRNAAATLRPSLCPDRLRSIKADRSRAAKSPSPSPSAASTEVMSGGKPIFSRVVWAAPHDSTAIHRPTERAIAVEDQLQQLGTHPTRQMSGESQEEEEEELSYARHRPRSDRGGEASASAETLLSLIRQNRGSTPLSVSGLSATASRTTTDSILEHGESQESTTDSLASTLESFSLHTVSKPVSPPVQRGDLNREQLTHIEQFKSAFAHYNAALAQHAQSHDSSAPSAPSRVNSNIFSPAQSQSGGKLKETLDEADIEIVEEEPVHREQTTLFGVRRRLVEHFDDLGRRSGRILSTKPSINMSRAATEQTKSMTQGSQRPREFVSEKERRKREDDLEAREKDLTIEALSKAEMATVRIEIWTESRKGKWIIRGPAENDGECGKEGGEEAEERKAWSDCIDPGYPPDELPLINNPWTIPIDSKGIVRRKKLKSNVELSSTRTVVECPHCSEGLQMGLQVQCRTCDNSFRVEMVYTVQVRAK